MRARTAAILLLLAPAACSVKLEGAACTGDDNCPGGQKCSFDGKCSNAAAACAEPICRPGSERCGSDGTIVACEAAPGGICATFKATGGRSCGPGLTCGPNVTCVDTYVVTLDAPAPGAVVGPTGVSVQATVTLASSAVAAPPTIKLLEGSTANSDLTLASQTGLQVKYQGTYVPGPTTNCSVALYAVSAYGTADATSSPAVTVAVEKFCGVTLDAPAPGTVVGPAGVAIQATVTLASSAVAAPPTIKLLEGSTANADLTLASQTGLQAHYQGTYVPGPTTNCSVALYAVAAYGTADATSSPAVRVVVCVVTLDAPAPGTVVGSTGVAVQATVTLASSAATAPSKLKLVEGSTAKADLNLTSQTGSQAYYQGSYSPGTTLDGSVTLKAVANYGTADAISSPGVTVIVDKTPPVISTATLACAAPCLRSSVLTLSANVTDLNPAPVTAQVTFPAPVGPVPVTLTAAGTTYSGTLDVGSLSSFPFFSQSVSATFTATDQAGNASQKITAPVSVTRRRWLIPVETASPPALTGPAVEAGSLFLGGGNGKVYKVDPLSGAIARWPVTSAAAAIAAAPAVGTTGLWVSGQDSKAYVLDKVSGTVLNTTCATIGATQTTAAVAMTGSVEAGYVASWNGSATQAGLYAVRLADCLQNLYSSGQPPAAPAVDSAGNVYVAIGTFLRRFHIVSSPIPAILEDWSTPVGAVSAPLAIDANPLIWTAATDGSLKKTTPGGSTTSAGMAGAAPDAPVLDAAGNVIVGDGTGVLHKMSPSGAALWASPPSLGAATASALVLSGGDAAYIVPTALGTVAAVKADGTVLWTGQVTVAAGTALREPNVLKLDGETFSTAVFGAADGSVYGVIVDGALDVNSPWPKAHHDTRNTGNAATPLP